MKKFQDGFNFEEKSKWYVSWVIKVKKFSWKKSLGEIINDFEKERIKVYFHGFLSSRYLLLFSHPWYKYHIIRKF